VQSDRPLVDKLLKWTVSRDSAGLQGMWFFSGITKSLLVMKKKFFPKKGNPLENIFKDIQFTL
jgi:hypothetical protein